MRCRIVYLSEPRAEFNVYCIYVDIMRETKTVTQNQITKPNYHELNGLNKSLAEHRIATRCKFGRNPRISQDVNQRLISSL